MDDNNGYAVFFFPQALEALGDALQPFLQDGPAGPHVACHTVDTGGAARIIDAEGRGNDARVQVNFRDAGVKWLALEYAKLEAA